MILLGPSVLDGTRLSTFEGGSGIIVLGPVDGWVLLSYSDLVILVMSVAGATQSQMTCDTATLSTLYTSDAASITLFSITAVAVNQMTSQPGTITALLTCDATDIESMTLQGGKVLQWRKQ